MSEPLHVLSLGAGVQERICRFSADRRYRYTLWREWDMLNPTYAAFIGLNPSTADASEDDPTIRRCVGFAKAFCHSSLIVVNLFAFRATSPADMIAAEDPIGPENAHYILETCAGKTVVLAWGSTSLGKRPSIRNRPWDVARTLRYAGSALLCFGQTASGAPKHPLYLPANAARTAWRKK